MYGKINYAMDAWAVSVGMPVESGEKSRRIPQRKQKSQLTFNVNCDRLVTYMWENAKICKLPLISAFYHIGNRLSIGKSKKVPTDPGV